MPYLLLTLAALFWGGNYVVGHVLVQGVDPILMTEARWALTALLLGLLYRRQIAGSRHLLRENAPAVLVLTLCGQVSFPLTLYIGLQTTSALNAAIYMSATPSMVLLINRLIFRDPVSARNWLGVVFSTLGVMILLIDKRQQQHRGGANDKHPAPAELCKQQPVGHGRQQIAERIPRLEQTGHQAARAVGDRLHRQRRSHAPDPAHRHAVQHPQQKKQHQRRRRGGEQLKGGEEHDIEHQDRFAAKLFRRPAEDQCADGPHGQGQQNRQGDLFEVDVKGVGDIAQ